MSDKGQRRYRLRDYINRVRIMADGGVPGRMPPELKERYADCIDQAERILWSADLAAQPKAASFFGYLIEQCEKARAYAFPESKERQSDSAVLANAPDYARMATALSTTLRDHQRAYGRAVGAAIIKAKVRLLGVGENGQYQDEPTDQIIALADVLRAFGEEAKTTDLTAQAGPWLYRFRHGPLMFPEPKEGKRASVPDPATCLSIFLACLIRNFVETGSYHWGRGDPIEMPGDEYWPLIEEAVSSALGVRPDPRIVRQFVRRNPDVTMCGYD